MPWRAFLRSTPVQALAYTHFANNWFHYTMLAWLPTYFVNTLSVDLMHASQTALLPPLAGILASAVSGAAADALISRGVRVSTVRKLMQNIAFVLPTGLLLAACTPAVADDPTATVAAITVSLGVSSFSLAGLFCTHQVSSRLPCLAATASLPVKLTRNGHLVGPACQRHVSVPVGLHVLWRHGVGDCAEADSLHALEAIARRDVGRRASSTLSHLESTLTTCPCYVLRRT